MDIVLFRTFLTNIGNGFIDKGARQTIERAFPNSSITEVSGYPLYASRQSSRTSLHPLAKVAGLVSEGESLPTQGDREFLHLGQFIDADLAVFPGCVLYPRLLTFFQKALADLADRNVPIVFLGAGGYYYDLQQRETKETQSLLNSLGNAALITRDQPAYDAFGGLFEYATPGIDNAFFISEWKEIPESNIEFDVHTFDNQEEPPIQSERRILRARHKPFGHAMPFAPPAVGASARYNDYSKGRLDKENLLISDLLEDYLFLYANGEETHSSRVHACVPALVYGNEARFYRETDRGSLFEQVVDGDISTELVGLSEERLEKKKAEQVEKLEAAATELL